MICFALSSSFIIGSSHMLYQVRTFASYTILPYAFLDLCCLFGSEFADHRNLNLSGEYFEFLLQLIFDFGSHESCLLIRDFMRLDHDAKFATSLKGIYLLDSFVS